MKVSGYSKVRVLIPTGLGLNCEQETAHAFRLLGTEPDLVHLTDLFTRHHHQDLAHYHVLAFIGGFAYGDHIGGGFVLATRVRAQLQDDLARFLEKGGLVLGICTGFQPLVRLGLLPGPDEGPHDFVPRAALAAIVLSAVLSVSARRFGWRLPGPANLSPGALKRLRHRPTPGKHTRRG